ncbi:baeRF3 domain-containing protein [Desulfovibrio psychrotolerans]|uniref:Uncharacterized protein n=1 Tax=Desulfovibrio psychrotolerans TaxID=415242 RepID=A0A7J0BY69_9BACT|nr:hypothetical protein [Desulfovibrio psychrotolerans]GFM38639.1 hypothetical protein DSM19430T_33230 [Desulfovibrio psychrotolerans]
MLEATQYERTVIMCTGAPVLHDARPKEYSMPHTRYFPTAEAMARLAGYSGIPCLTLYQPTHRHHPDNQQDTIRFVNLVKRLGTALRSHCSEEEARWLLEPFDRLGQDREFWNHSLDGLAVMAAPGLFEVFTLQQAVQEMALVADSFHTKPLRRFMQATDRYQILGLSRDRVRLYEGNRHHVDRIDLPAGVPGTIAEALGDELTEPHQTVASYGGVGGPSAPMRHGSGGKKDELDADAERFFRAVDRAVLEHCSRPSGLPLILAALPEYHNLFRKVSHNPNLVPAAIAANPEALSPEDLRDRAWECLAPQHDARLKDLAEAFETARARGAGSDNLTDVAAAAAAGKVATLFIEYGRYIPGRLNPETGLPEPAAPGTGNGAPEGSANNGADNMAGNRNHGLSDTATGVAACAAASAMADDLLDDLGELVERMGGEVLVVPAEQLPGKTGLAAIFRY